MSAGTAQRRRIAKRWDEIGEHDLVEIKGRLYTVVKVKPLGKAKLKVTIRDPETREKYASTVKRQHGVDVVELVKRKTKGWKKPDDDAEKVIVKELGGVLIGVQPTDEEWYVCPMTDISTLAAHLFLFHGISPVDLSTAEAVEETNAIHDADHEKAPGQLHVPHIHEPQRPVIEIGPRFE